MFTGLVEACGTVAKITPEGDGVRLEIAVPPLLVAGDISLGDSIAVSGCCLTVISIRDTHWEFQAGTETLSKTHLGQLRPGSRVNLERALQVGSRLGGHFVQGHVDGVGQVAQVEPHGDWTDLHFQIPRALARYMVPKGSIAIDGVSLTLVRAEPERISVALIPHTLSATTLGALRPGDPVNLEVDMLAKYVERLLADRPGVTS